MIDRLCLALGVAALAIVGIVYCAGAAMDAGANAVFHQLFR